MTKPDIASIEAGKFVEGDACDFKRQVNLDQEEGRKRLLDDVVAFLNRGPAHIFIGVEERGGGFAGFVPMHGDPDQFERRLLSIIQTGVHPTPLDVRVHILAVGTGWIANLDLPHHENGPFQNAHSGAFLTRTGSKNTPILREVLQSSFRDRKQWLADVVRLSHREAQEIIASGRMVDKGPYLQIGILPRQHFDPSIPMFEQDAHWRKMAPAFGDHMSVSFKGGAVGHEAIGEGLAGGIDRLLIRDDWFVHAYIAHPMWVTAGDDRLTFHEFKSELPDYLAQLDELFLEHGIEGPFAVVIELHELQRSSPVGRYFRGLNSVQMIRPQIVRRVTDPDLIAPFLKRVHRATIYG